MERPESPELDDKQNLDLFEFLKSQPKKKLRKELKRIESLSTTDSQMGGTGVPANTNKARNFIRMILGID